MKRSSFISLLLILMTFLSVATAGLQKPNLTLPSTVYLFSSFRGNGDGLHLAWSADGLKWTALAEDRILLQPTVGDKLMRDPFILHGPDGVFRMVWTSGWYERVIGYASSKDLIHWSEQKAIPVMEQELKARNCWAPEIAFDGGAYHMFLTLVPGVFTDWNHPRDIIHLTSTDLLTWKFKSTLKLSSDRVIDACAYHLPDGTWRMWYNNERDRKSIYYADSRDLMAWVDHGKVVGVGERPGEGPKVFRWKGYYWMVVDIWQGLGVYRSDDAIHWAVQDGNLVEMPGKGADDEVKGGHPDVVVSGDRAFLFYFTHPGRRGADEKKDG